jgi:hypothetical protein
MDYEQKQREAFYLIKKYSSYTWYAEIYRLWKAFCDGYEMYMRDPDKYLLGRPVTPWWEENLKVFWGYLANMEEGLEFIRQGNKLLGYGRFSGGCSFPEWLYSRRFQEMDLSEIGYRRTMAEIAEGIFLHAQKADAMAMAGAIHTHIDDLRRDYVSLQDTWATIYANTAHKIKIPFGVPPGELPLLPIVSASAPTVMSGQEVPCMGIWIVEPDEAHKGHTYCMAYLRQWWPALETVSEQEHELNTRYERTREEEYRKDWDKINDYPVRWRLLWRDDRDYTHGNTSNEESDYLTYYETGVAQPIDIQRLRCEGGQPCPKSGFWATPAKQDSRREFTQGNIMPSLGGDYGVTIWEWQAS